MNKKTRLFECLCSFICSVKVKRMNTNKPGLCFLCLFDSLTFLIEQSMLLIHHCNRKSKRVMVFVHRFPEFATNLLSLLMICITVAVACCWRWDVH